MHKQAFNHDDRFHTAWLVVPVPRSIPIRIWLVHYLHLHLQLCHSSDHTRSPQRAYTAAVTLNTCRKPCACRVQEREERSKPPHQGTLGPPSSSGDQILRREWGGGGRGGGKIVTYTASAAAFGRLTQPSAKHKRNLQPIFGLQTKICALPRTCWVCST